MAVSYVLIKCNLGAEKEVIENLKKIDTILFVDEIYGAYDIIIKIEASNIEKLREILTWDIQKMDKIRSILSVNKKEI